MNKPSIAVTHSKLLSEWDYSRNIKKPEDYTFGTATKVWWVCSKNHSWEAQINARAKGTGCPYCANKKVLVGFNDLATTRPELLSIWDYDKNAIKPEEIVAKSEQKVWWICPKKHSYQTSVKNYPKGNDCPICLNRVVLQGTNDLVTTNPELLTYWDYDKNTIKPDGITSQYVKKVWWKCDNGHSFQKTPRVVTKNFSCPDCVPVKTVRKAKSKLILNNGSLANAYPALMTEWDYEKNTIDPMNVRPGSHKKAHWVCSEGHSWVSEIKKRAEGSRCPYCANKKIWQGYNDLATTHPHLLIEWDYDKNTVDPSEVSPGSIVKRYWLCDKGHSYQNNPKYKVLGQSCPVCLNRKTVVGLNDFVTVHSAFMQYWDYDKNTLNPTEITGGYDKPVWWKCSEGHSYSKRAYNMSTDTENCFVCENDKLFIRFSELQWDYDKNTFGITTDRISGSIKYYWLCSLGHSFEGSTTTMINHKQPCPYCGNRKVLAGFNDLTTTHPDLIKEWDYSKNTIKPTEITYGLDCFVWWLCPKGHAYETRLKDRTRTISHGCPKCSYAEGGSKGEKELADFIKNILPDTEIIENDRSVLRPKELDIYIPGKKIAIEFNGIYWHSEAAGKGEYYHHDKWLACKNAGVQLIQIWEDDWVNNRPVVEKMLAHKLGVSTQDRVFARETVVKPVDKVAAKKFLEDNHLQGDKTGCSTIGLFVKGSSELVAVISYQFRKGTCMLERFATSRVVVGGFSKLLAQLRRECVKKDVETITSFSDHEVSDGSLYRNNGFVFVGESVPGYYYIHNGVRRHRFGYRKDRFKSRDDLLFEDGLTERELAELNGLDRCYGSGNDKFVLTV